MRAKNNIIAYALSIVVALILFIIVFIFSFVSADFKFGWVETEAQVTSVPPPSNDMFPGVEFHYTYTDYIISYEVDGKVYEHKKRIDNDDPIGFYTTLPIKYNPKNPDEYIIKREPTFSYRSGLVLIIFPFIIIRGIIAIIVNMKRYKQRKAERTESEQGYKLN